MPNAAAKTKSPPQSKRRQSKTAKAPLRSTLKSSSWYLNASQSIAIGRGRDYRGGHQWVRQIDQGHD